jgi:hypothetical protein
MSKEFFKVSNIMKSNSSNYNSNISIKSNDYSSNEKIDNKNKIKKIKNIIDKDKKSLVSFNETERRPVTFPKRFNWKLYAKIVNHPSVINEEKAIEHFKKYAHNQSKLAKLYFRTIYKIPNLFDEDSYLEYLKSFNLKLDKNTIEIEKLYHFFSKTGKDKYPLNDSYFRILYNIPYHFDYISYCNRYSTIDFDKEDVNSIYNYFSSDKNTKHHLDDEYGRLKYNIPQHFDVSAFKKRYDLEYQDNFDLYEFYSKNNDKNFSLDDKYLQIRYNIPENFKLDTYKKRYSEIKNMDTISIYNFYANSKTNKLDDQYFRILYDIPNDFCPKTYLKRYTDENIGKSNIEVYKYYIENKDNYVLDDKYYRFLYNIPDFFDKELYNNLYKNCPTNINQTYDFYSKNKEKYPLNEYYFDKYFGFNKNNFNWIFYKNNFLFPDASIYDSYNHFFKNTEKNNYYKLYYKLDEDFNWESYYHKYKNYFHLDETILNIDEQFIFQFVGGFITLEYIYNIYLNNDLSLISKKFINNYKFISKIGEIKTEDDKRYFYHLENFLQCYFYDENYKKYMETKNDETLYELHINNLSLIEDNINKLENSKLIKMNTETNDIEKKNKIYNETINIINKIPIIIDPINLESLFFDLDLLSLDYLNQIQNIVLTLCNDLQSNKEDSDNKLETLQTINLKLVKLIQDKEKYLHYKDYLTLKNSQQKKVIKLLEDFNQNKKKNLSKKYTLKDKSNNIYTLNLPDLKGNQDLFPLFKNDYLNLYDLYIDNLKNNFDTDLKLHNLKFPNKKEIVIFMLDKQPHNDLYIKKLLNVFNESWRLTVICSNYNFEFITKLPYNNKFNIINLKDNLEDTNDFNEMLLNVNFWDLFESEIILLLNNFTFISENIFDDFIENNKVTFNGYKKIIDKKTSYTMIEGSLINKDYIIEGIKEYNYSGHGKFISSFIIKDKEKHYLENIKCDFIFSNITSKSSENLENYHLGKNIKFLNK